MHVEKSSHLCSITATKKMQKMREYKACNGVDWGIRNTSSAYKRSVQESDNGKKLERVFTLTRFCILSVMGERSRQNEQDEWSFIKLAAFLRQCEV